MEGKLKEPSLELTGEGTAQLSCHTNHFFASYSTLLKSKVRGDYLISQT